MEIPEIQEEIQATKRDSADNEGMILCLALNYGARSEITHAMQQIATKVQDGLLQPQDISDETIAAHLMTVGMPDPDLVIRTANEMRLSNFLLWQISYSELWITETFWPEFRNPHLHTALRDFAARDRRYGGLGTSATTLR